MRPGRSSRGPLAQALEDVGEGRLGLDRPSAGPRRTRRLRGQVAGQQAEVARLVLGVGPDRDDAVLGAADEHELAAGADQVDRAAGAERHARLGAQADAVVALLLGGLHLPEDPGQAVDDGHDDGQADEGAGQRALPEPTLPAWACRRRPAGSAASFSP